MEINLKVVMGYFGDKNNEKDGKKDQDKIKNDHG